jgi:hypothetical protein
MDRATVLAALGVLGGGAGLWLSLKNLSRAVRFRFQRGRPYIPGSLRRSILATAVFLSVFLVGATLGSVRWLLSDYQPVDDVTRAARVRVRELDGGELLLELEPDRRHPERRPMAVGLPGATWEVAGVVISFPSWIRLLGLDASHRLAGAGAPSVGGGTLPARAQRAADLFAGLPAALQVRVERHAVAGRGPIEWTGVMVSRDGYFLGPEDGGESDPF